MAERIRIGAMLLDEGVVTEEQLEEALRAQVVRGGRIGTNIIERFGLDLDYFADVLAVQHSMRSAHQVHFEAADPEVVRRLPSELAHHWHAIPIGAVEGLPPDHVAVAVLEPLSGFGEDELCTGLGAQIVAAVAPELRIHYYLEKLYGKPRSNRFKRVPTSIVTGAVIADRAESVAGPPGEERRRYIETLDGEGGPDEEVVLARIGVRQGEIPARARFRGERAPTMNPASIDTTLRAIRRATGRDAIGDIVVTALREGLGGCVDAGVIMVIRDEVAVGWKGFVRGGVDETAQELAVPLTLPSRFSDACQTGALYIGPPAEDARIERRLWQILGTPPAASLAVIPIALQGEIVCLLYAQSSEPGALEEEGIESLPELGTAMSGGFERLARAAQR